MDKRVMHVEVIPWIHKLVNLNLILVLIVSALSLTVRPASAAPDCDNPPNEIVAENCLVGNPPSQWDVSGAGDPTIQGFATDISVNRGGTIQFKIDTTAAAYTIPIYRLGYYGGAGARLVATITPTAVTDQPACNFDSANRNLLDCGNWSVSASWTVPADATSGVYVARPTRTDTNGASHIVFIVRDDGGTSDLLFQTSDTTWQAYNPYGGYNAYGSSGATMAEKLSYNRPFATRGAELENWLFNAEYPMIRWLERNGYDVSYMSALDVERYGSLLLNHQVYLSVGHDEYWSQGRRDAVTAARDAGVHLAFFSANEIYWKIRWEDSATTGTSYDPGDRRIQVTYKEGSAAPSGAAEHRNCFNNYDCDPSPIWTGLWREAPETTPENSLSGQISWRLTTPGRTITVPAEYAPMRFWRNTAVASLGPSQQATLGGAVLGYEWDPEYAQYADWYPAGRLWLSSTNETSFAGLDTHHLSLYRAPSGALVFGAGTVQWSWGLDSNHDYGTSAEDVNIQQATVNLFADMGVQPGSLQDGLVAAAPSTDSTPPVVTVTAPAQGASVAGGIVTVTGTASDVGGVVGVVEISTDDGITWRRASGRADWSYSYFAAAGPAEIRVRAADDSANLGSPVVRTFDVAPRTCPCSIWTPEVGGGQTYTDAPVELGLKFRASADGYITAIRFWKPASGVTGTHTGRLWSASGVMLGETTFTAETASGWQEATFAAPVAITANTTYIASYHAPSGYTSTNNYFNQSFDNPPLYALANGVDGPNGVYKYGPAGTFPIDTYLSSNYWVDVVFTDSVGPDTTPPTILSTSPAAGVINVPVAANVSATFNEPLDSATVSVATFELRDSSNALVAAAVSYNNATRTITLAPNTSLAFSSAYTARLVGGAGGIKDLAGNPLSADATWTFTTAPVPPPPPDEGPGGPILVVGSAANPFGRYFAEILRAEGLNAFTVTDISQVDAAVLNQYDVVILGEMPLTTAQFTLLGEWVSAGGNLIAMRPHATLSGLLGLTPLGGTLSEAYLLVNTAAPPGAGIVNQSMQYHGAADRYSLSGASALATLYSTSTTATAYPAVTLRSVGSNGGQAAAFTFDLAKSIVLTRQGNPDWVNTNGDGSPGPVRADDLFHNGTDPDWVDLNKVAIPQADEQQRLLANLIGFMNQDKKPLPRFWYLPRGEKAVVVMTADDHASPNVAGRFEQYKAASPVGCSVDDWECIRSSIYIYSGSTLSAAQANAYTAEGFEIGAHIDTDCANYTLSQLDSFYTTQLAAFTARFPALPKQDSERTHCIAWSGWAFQANIKAQKGIRLDTNYYYWPPAWVADRPGFMTGSGIPMRFAELDGTLIDVYQAATQMTDESGQTYPYTINTLLDRALGPEGYYGVFTANLHSDSLISSQSEAVLAAAQARGVPIVSGRQMLTWLDGRNASSFASLVWSGSTLSFQVNAHANARGLQALLPAHNGSLTLQTLTRNGTPVAFSLETVKGVSYARFAAESGAYVAAYAADTTPPAVTTVTPANLASGVPVQTTVTAFFSEPMDAATIHTGSFELRAPGNMLVPATVSYNSGANMATLTPNAALDFNTTYTATLLTAIRDAAGNPLTANVIWTFTTAADNCPCTIWNASATPLSAPVNDSQPIEVGTKFRADSNGYITAIRFYKGAGDTDTHVGHLWTAGGTQLAAVTFTGESASGWQQMSLPAPVAITANTTYIVSVYSSPAGNFAITPGGLASAVSNPPLRALASGEDGPNGVYRYGGGFPNNGNNANYWVDAVFEFNPLIDSTPPAITGRSPEIGATDVPLDVTISVTFSEAMEPATITTSSIRMRASGAGSDVPAVVSYANGVVTLDPMANLQASTVYQVTVDGTVTDAAGNPLGSNAVWTFTTSNQLPITDSSAADFNAGTPGACAVDAAIGSGALRLGAGLSEHFSGAALPAGWTTHSWTGGSPVVGGGVLTVDGAEAYSVAQYGPGRTLEFSATFGAQAFQNVGFAGANPPFNQSPWIMFSTSNDGAQLYARVLPPGSSAYNSGNDKIPLGNYIGTPHTYRIDWLADRIDFYVDGTLKASVTAVITAGMNIAISDYQIGTSSLAVDWLRMTPPYASPCAFTSRIFDAGALVNWRELLSVTTIPAGTSLAFETRTGNSAAPDGAWSGWQAVNSPVASPHGRYAQYRVTLSTADPAQTPLVDSVTLTYSTLQTPTITWNDPAAITYGTPLGAGQLNATASVPGVFVYTPPATTVLDAGTHTLRADFTPTDTETYTIASKEVTLQVNPAAATVSLSNLSQTYDGAPKPVTVTTNPSGLSVTVTYNGSPTPPSAVGSYAVAATVTHPNYTGSANGTLVISLATAMHSISLVPGWNLVSFNVQPADTQVAAVLASLAGNYSLVYAWDSSGAHASGGHWVKYDPAVPFGNSLTNLNATMGFWILMTAPDTLEVTGTIPVTTTIPLSTAAGGWNLVGYPAAGSQPLPDALSANGVGTDFTRIYAYHANDTSDMWKLFDRNAPGYANDLTQLNPGWGYWVYVTADHTWTVAR